MRSWLVAALLSLPAAARAQQCSLPAGQTEDYCHSARPQDCAAARRLYEDAAALDAEISRCIGGDCSAQEAIRLTGRVRELDHRRDGMENNFRLLGAKACLELQLHLLAILAQRQARADLRAMPAAEDVERRIAALEAQPPAARSPQDLQAADQALDGVYRYWRRLSFELDQTEVLNDTDASLARARVNALAKSLGAWRDRLGALRRAAGLPAAEDAGDAIRKLSGLHVPAAALPPDVYGFTPGKLSPRVPTDAQRDDLARHLTAVIGDPKGLAPLVHLQEGQDCDVVAQQQVLQAYGAAKPGLDQERALSRESWDRGFRSPKDQGTFGRFGAGLLKARGFVVAERHNAKPQDLEAAVRSGRLMTINVDSGAFWGERKYDGKGHTVLVTGARVDASGKLLGYYVNDSGTNDGGRFVPAEDLYKAWTGDFAQVR